MSQRPKKYTDIMALARKCVTKGHYYDSRHATDRKTERKITLTEILHVFNNGFHEKKKDEFKSAFNDWNYAIKGKKIQKKFTYKGFGFPVVFHNVPMVKVRGVWTPDVNYNKVTNLLLLALSQKSSRLTGNEIRFIRHSFEMTLEQFAKRFSVSHPAVKKWEDCDNHSTAVSWTTEKDIRLLILEHLKVKPVRFVKLYIKLAEALHPAAPSEPFVLDLKKAA